MASGSQLHGAHAAARGRPSHHSPAQQCRSWLSWRPTAVRPASRCRGGPSASPCRSPPCLQVPSCVLTGGVHHSSLSKAARACPLQRYSSLTSWPTWVSPRTERSAERPFSCARENSVGAPEFTRTGGGPASPWDCSECRPGPMHVLHLAFLAAERKPVPGRLPRGAGLHP